MLRTHLTKPMNSNWIHTSVATVPVPEKQWEPKGHVSHVACPIAHHRQLRSIPACTPCVVVVKYIVWNVEGYSKSALPKPTNLGRFEMAGGKWNSPWYSFKTPYNSPQKKKRGRILEVSQGRGTKMDKPFTYVLAVVGLHMFAPTFWHKNDPENQQFVQLSSSLQSSFGDGLIKNTLWKPDPRSQGDFTDIWSPYSSLASSCQTPTPLAASGWIPPTNWLSAADQNWDVVSWYMLM